MKSYFMSILTDQPNESFGAIVKRQLKLKEERAQALLHLIQVKGAPSDLAIIQ